PLPAAHGQSLSLRQNPKKMKHNPRVTSSRRKCRKAHFTAPSSVRRVLMSAPLSADLRAKHNVRCTAASGSSTSSGSPARRSTDPRSTSASTPQKVVVTKLKLDKDRKSLLDRKAKGPATDKANKGKFTVDDVVAGGIQEID
ncbi:hypothetical protein RJ639_015724, partial [Escallonia herrerae]